MKTFLEQTTPMPPSINSWKKVGAQKGSNPGGVYENEKGEKHYVKFPPNPEQAKHEVASNRIHKMVGVPVAYDSFLVHHKGQLGVAAKWNEHLRDLHTDEATKTMDAKTAGHFGRLYHAGVLTKNWDIVGGSYPNIQKHTKTGELQSIDQGGSFNFRAQGGHKDYDSDVSELHTLRDPSKRVGHILNHAFKHFPHAEQEGLKGTHDLAYNDVHNVFKDVGIANHKEMADTLWSRRSAILKHYGKNTNES